MAAAAALCLVAGASVGVVKIMVDSHPSQGMSPLTGTKAGERGSAPTARAPGAPMATTSSAPPEGLWTSSPADPLQTGPLLKSRGSGFQSRENDRRQSTGSAAPAPSSPTSRAHDTTDSGTTGPSSAPGDPTPDGPAAGPEASEPGAPPPADPPQAAPPPAAPPTAAPSAGPESPAPATTPPVTGLQAALTGLNALNEPTAGNIVGVLPQVLQAPAGALVGQTYAFRIPADSTPATTRRTEYLWQTDGVDAAFGSGQTVRWVALLQGNLGRAVDNDNDWHVVWQLHGRSQRGWMPPPVTLVVQNNRLRLSGGRGHPAEGTNGNTYGWVKDLAPYVDGKIYRIEIVTKLSPDPSQASITATINGQVEASDYHPVSNSGIPTGTIYADQPTVDSRCGLYRGTSSGPAPTYEQSVAIRMIRAG